MINPWQGAPQSVRIIVLAIVVVLAYGTVVHVVQLVASGFDPYQGMPGWLRTYFIALTVDPLTAVLLARRHRSGVALAVVVVVVLVSDATANGFANYALAPAVGVTARSHQSGGDHDVGRRCVRCSPTAMACRLAPPESPLTDPLRGKCWEATAEEHPVAERRHAGRGDVVPRR